MLFLSSVNLKLRDLAASLVPHLMTFAETGHLSVPRDEVSDEMDDDDYPDEVDPEALHILVNYLSAQWIPPGPVKHAYDHVVKSLHYDS